MNDSGFEVFAIHPLLLILTTCSEIVIKMAAAELPDPKRYKPDGSILLYSNKCEELLGKCRYVHCSVCKLQYCYRCTGQKTTVLQLLEPGI